MIEAVEIINGQGHLHSLLEFHPGLNIIKGESHEGKSTIARMMKWALTNRPTDADYLSWLVDPDESVETAVQFSDDEYIKRTKGKNINQYEVSGYDEPFKALRSDVPDEVSLVTKMDDVNIQSQFDKFFMLNDTPGEVAKKFNKLLDLEIIDTTQGNINSKIREVETTIKVHKRTLAELVMEYEGYDFLDKIEGLINEVDTLSTNFNEMEEEHKGLVHIVIDIDLAREKIKILNRKAKAEKDIKEALSIVEEYKSISSEIEALININEEINQAEYDIEMLGEISIHESEIKECKKLALEIKEIDFERVKLIKLCTDIERMEKTRDMASKKAVAMEKERNALLKSQGICPLCGSRL